MKAVVMYIHPEVFSGNGYADMEGKRMLAELVRLGREGQHELPLSASTLQELETILVPLSLERVETAPGYAMDVRSAFEKMLVALIRDACFSGMFRAKPPEASQRMEQVFHFVEVHYPNPLGIEEVAAMCGLSRSHFHALFREAAGCGFVEYLNRVRIRKACELLRFGDLPLIEVGLSCGFETLAHFYRCFNRYEGQAPGAYRKQLKHS